MGGLSHRDVLIMNMTAASWCISLSAYINAQVFSLLNPHIYSCLPDLLCIATHIPAFRSAIAVCLISGEKTRAQLFGRDSCKDASHRWSKKLRRTIREIHPSQRVRGKQGKRIAISEGYLRAAWRFMIILRLLHLNVCRLTANPFSNSRHTTGMSKKL